MIYDTSMSVTTNQPYLIALHSIDGLGPVRLKRLLDIYQDPKLVWNADPRELVKLGIPRPVIEKLNKARQEINPGEYSESLFKSGIKILTLFDDDYPSLLKQIYDPPVVIFYRGKILSKDQNAIGIVGTRKITGYGKIITEDFTRRLSRSGLTIVSGLARGVDTIAHKSAIAEEGRTLAVLGGGINHIFPPENSNLAKQIEDFGAVLSEFPPDYPHLAGNFPSRNRIIAGLSKAVLVTEAALDSGSLITARAAIEEGRDVFAIPGPITSQLSFGPSQLIKEGAKLVTTPEEILAELGIQSEKKVLKLDLSKLSEIEKLVLACLENESKHIDEICRELNRPPAEVSSALLKMEIQGLIKNLNSGVYSKFF